MSKGSKSTKKGVSKISQMDIQPSLVNAWLAKNKTALSAQKEKAVSISDCPSPWG